ncbi:cell division FtsA domain-containing protein [bacterium]|nr:cell division FtsA domain-containing protein [bacterium]
MQIDIKDAEEIKKTHGTAISNRKPADNDQLDVLFLTEIISSRYEEIFEKINKHLKALDRD